MLEEYERQAEDDSRWGRFIAIGVTIVGVAIIGIYLASI
jgi:hypothetical protein